MRKISNASSNDTTTSGKKLIPWEPKKPAVRDANSLPPLIPYSLPKVAHSEHSLSEELIHQIRAKKNGLHMNGHSFPIPIIKNTSNVAPEHNEKRSAERVNSQNESLQRELEIEREVNQELKKLLVAALSDDVQCHVQSLAEDKIRLAKNMDKFAYQVTMDAERVNELCIENNIWRCKYLAMGIKADELAYNLHRVVSCLRNGQKLANQVLNDPAPSTDSKLCQKLKEFSDFDATSLLNKSPCERMHSKAPPMTSKLTISCCKKCAGKEIELI